jgi:endogenous inhibitor of DNA gyrase (YacG/DUF329 family)
VTAEQRTCPSCGTEFTWTPAAPRKKFCSIRCKHRWHTAHRKPRSRRRGRPPAARDDPRPAPPATGVAATAPVAPPPGPAGLTAAPACPHCRQPVALVAWLVPPAASVTTPPRHADTIRDNQ